jgi:hypothetical protein
MAVPRPRVSHSIAPQSVIRGDGLDLARLHIGVTQDGRDVEGVRARLPRPGRSGAPLRGGVG